MAVIYLIKAEPYDPNQKVAPGPRQVLNPAMQRKYQRLQYIVLALLLAFVLSMLLVISRIDRSDDEDEDSQTE